MIMEVRVYLNYEAYSSRKWVYCRQVEVNGSVEFPFNQILSAMRVLYGNTCVVEFLVMASV